jgi:hypothetical protein
VQHVLKAAVPILGLAQTGFGIEVDVAKHAFELRAVVILDFLKGDVDFLADVRLVPRIIKVVETGAFRQNKALALKSPADMPPTIMRRERIDR